jgi:hypothetical protein
MAIEGEGNKPGAKPERITGPPPRDPDATQVKGVPLIRTTRKDGGG